MTQRITYFTNPGTSHVGTLGDVNGNLERYLSTSTTRTVNGNASHAYYVPDGHPSQTTWPNQTFKWYLRITTANVNFNLTAVTFYRLNSARTTTVDSEVDTTTSFPITCSSVTTISGTHTWSNIGGSTASDTFAIRFTFVKTGGHGGDSIWYGIGGSVDTRVDTTLLPSTTLYFHAATDSTSGLPTAEQSTRTADINVEGSQTTNRSMTDTKGTSQASLVNSAITSPDQTHYFTRFVSLPLTGVSTISAAMWWLNFASSQDNIAANFPLTNTSTRLVIGNLYVWRPSTQSKIGTVFDTWVTEIANSDDNGTNEAVNHLTFTGSSVSSISDNDVLIFEFWWIGGSDSGTQTGRLFYDGTTETLTDGTTVSNHASFIEANGVNLSFAVQGETFQRPVSDTITLSDSATRPKVARAITDTVSKSESLNRVATFQRLASDTRSISDSLLTYKIRVRSAQDTITLTEATTRPLIGRAKSDTITLSDSVNRVPTFQRTASDTITVTDSVQKFLVLLRALSDTVNLSDTATRIYTVLKSASDTVSLSDSAARVAEFVRTPQDTITLSDSVSKLVTLIKNLVDTIILSETVQKIKNPGEGTTYMRNVSDTIIVAEELLRSLTAIRAIQDTVSLSDTAAKILTAIRNIADTTTLSDTATRLFTAIKTASDTINLTESIQRVYTALRTASEDTTSISDTVQRLYTALRTAQDTTSLSESVSRILQALRTVSDSLGLAPPARFIYHHYLADVIPSSESVQGIFIQGALLFDRFRSSFGGFGR